MKTRPSSTTRFESTITIDRPIDDVFARLTNLEGYGAWMPHTGLFGSCRQTSDGPVGKGTTFIDSSRMGRFSGEVTDFERPSRVTFGEAMRVFGWEAMRARAGYSLRSNGTRTV
ncbi:MAG: SRPBCC family protein, partial [Chloroflexota bacterium]|nr:SRPBCC family protein [Chloroflexota bacterium]